MEKIGLQAVMEMADFTNGMSDYNKKVADSSDETEKKSGKMSAAFAAVGKAAVGLAVGGIAALAGTVVGSMKVFGDWAETVGNTSDVLGTTAEESSTLAVAAKTVGGDVNTLVGQMAKLNKGLLTTEGELGPTGKRMEELGIEFRDANGQLLPATQILQNVADKVGNMDDGLEKTDIMMDLFGQSGKEMGDLLGLVADQGMDKLSEKTKSLGLSLTGEGVAGAEAFGRSMADLKMAGQGLMVTISSELLPVIQPLIEKLIKIAMDAMPAVKDAIGDIIPVIEDLAEWFGDNIIPIIEDVVIWLKDNLPPAIQKAGEFFNEKILPVLKDVWAFIKDYVIPVIIDIVTWLADNIPPAIETAAQFFNDVILPVLRDVWSFIRDSLIPIIIDIITWLKDNIPPAIDTAVKWFKENLLPAIRDVWDFVEKNLLPILADIITWLGTTIKTTIFTFKNDIWPGIVTAFTTAYDFVVEDLIPTFNKIKDWLETTIKGAIEIFKGIWGGLKTAFEDVRDFIRDELMPKFNAILEFIRDKIAGPINSLVNGALDGLNKAFGILRDILSPVVDFFKWIIENVGKALGIGQEFTNNVLGAADQLYRDLTGRGEKPPNPRIPQPGEPGGPGGGQRPPPPDTFAGIGSIGGSGGMAVYNNNNVNIYLTASINNGMDLQSFQTMILDTVKGAL